MGEEDKKVEDVKKPEEKKDDPPPADKPAADAGGEAGGEKKAEAAEESKDPPPPPPPPQEIVLKVYMHCEGCARKVRRCLKGFPGVEDVVTDCKSHKVVVKGEKADPLKVVARVQKKSHRQVELISPIPPPPAAAEPIKPPEEAFKPEEKKEEPQVITVVLKVHMHCEACAQEIKRRIQRMKGVESVEPDFKGSMVTVKGVFEPPKLVEYVAKRTGKRAEIVKVEPEKKEAAEAEEKPKEGSEDKEAGAAGEGGEKEEKKGEEAGDATKDKKEGEEVAAASAVAEAAGAAASAADAVVEVLEDPKLELKKNELFYYYYPPPNYYHPNLAPLRVAQEMHGYGYGYPPQMFSDENPNACSVM